MAQITTANAPVIAEVHSLRREGVKLIRRLFELARTESGQEDRRRAALLATDLIWSLSVDCAIFMRQLVVDEEIAQELPDVRRFVVQSAKHRKFFPVPFSELVDLTPYRKLEIGHLLKESQNPKLRSGKSVFSPYALHIVRRLEFLRAEQRAKVRNREKEFRNSAAYLYYGLRDSVPRRAFRAHRNLSEEEFQMRTLIHSAVPKELEALTRLDPFTRKTATEWVAVSKVFFKQVFPQPERVQSLSNAINDSNIEHESQIRAQIVERFGRAVAALARL